MRLAYHREIGREATAAFKKFSHVSVAYHREIGREATAMSVSYFTENGAYHREIGREATAYGRVRTKVVGSSGGVR